MDIKNLSIIRQAFASTVFTHKVQEVAAEFQEKRAFWIKIINIILVSLVVMMLVLQASYPQNLIFTYIGTGISIAEIIFLIVQLSFSFEQRMVAHKNSALKYMGVRDQYKLLITDVMNEAITQEELLAKRNLLQQEYQVISELAPQTGDKEYIEAQKRLNKRGEVPGEEFTWSDEEIDWFLPETLRLKK